MNKLLLCFSFLFLSLNAYAVEPVLDQQGMIYFNLSFDAGHTTKTEHNFGFRFDRAMVEPGENMTGEENCSCCTPGRSTGETSQKPIAVPLSGIGKPVGRASDAQAIKSELRSSIIKLDGEFQDWHPSMATLGPADRDGRGEP